MKVYFLIFLIPIIYSLSPKVNLGYTPPIELFQAKNDLSVFKLEEASNILRDIQVGKWRKEEHRVIMYDKDILYPRNNSGYEAQINDNFEVVKMDNIVDLLDNGYILSGDGEGEDIIRENIKKGQFIIFIKEMNSIYLFEPKDKYKNAYYFSKINLFLKELYEKMINESLYDELYYTIYDLNYLYKVSVTNRIPTNYADIYSQLRDLYNQYINISEKVDPSTLSYTPTVDLEPFDYQELYTTEKNVNPNNLILELNISHEGGPRLTDELVKYNDNSTIRNQWGYEVGVNKNGNIISRGILVTVPEGGYVLSGHGIYSDLLNARLQIGDYIIYKNLHATIYRDTSIQVVNNIGLQTNLLVEKYKKFMDNKIPLYYDEIAKNINKLIIYYNSINKDELNFDIKTYFTLKEFDYESIIFSIKYLFIEPNPVETQSLWHTPNLVFNFYDESKKEGIQKFLKDVSESGFNRIYLESNEVGTAYYNSTILKPHEIFGKPYGEYKDYLDCFVHEAHKLNIEVITWVQVFRARGEGKELAPCYKEEWLSIDYYGKTCNFFDSTNPEVHEFLMNQFSELVSNYSIDGLEYDYIRYDISNILDYPSKITDYGYTNVSIKMFKELYNYSETEDIKEILKSNKSRYDWVEFKKQRITDLLISSKARLRAINENLIFTAAVYYDPSTINGFMQDWPKWLDNEIINFVEPMMYQKDTNYFITHDVQLFLSAILRQEDEYMKKKVIFGISPVVYGGSYLDYIDQMEYVLNLHSSYSIFCCLYIFTYNKLVATLKKYSYKSLSYTDKFEKKVDALAKELIKKIEQYYKQIDKEEDFSGLINALNDLIGSKTQDNVNKVFEQIKLIKDEVIRNNTNYAFFKVDNYKVE